MNKTESSIESRTSHISHAFKTYTALDFKLDAAIGDALVSSQVKLSTAVLHAAERDVVGKQEGRWQLGIPSGESRSSDAVAEINDIILIFC